MKKNLHIVRVPQAVTTTYFAPSGAGKSTGIVLPFLMIEEESCVVLDLSGELAEKSALQRKHMGQEIVILDPYHAVRDLPFRTATWNPIDCIDKDSPLAIDDAMSLANALVVRTGEEKEPHWNDSAEAAIAALIATTAFYGQGNTRSLQDVDQIGTDPDKLLAATELMSMSPAWGGMLARMAGRLKLLAGDERASVLSTMAQHLQFLRTPAIAESTRTSSFDPRLLKRGKQTVYIVCPPEYIRAMAGWLRMVISSMFRAIVHEGADESRKVHFVLDEAASLGQMDALDDAVDKFRKYGVRCQYFYQSYGQLKKSWPKDQGHTLLSNSTKVFFGTSDIETANLVSSMLGKQTIVVKSGGTSSQRGSSDGHSTDARGLGGQNWGRNDSTSSSESWQQAPRELLRPEEITGLSNRVAMTFTAGMPPIWTQLVRHYEAPWLYQARRVSWWKGLRIFAKSAFWQAIVLLNAAFFTLALWALGLGAGWK